MFDWNICCRVGFQRGIRARVEIDIVSIVHSSDAAAPVPSILAPCLLQAEGRAQLKSDSELVVLG